MLYLGPDEAPGDNVYIVPSDYRTSEGPDGGMRLRFDTGSYAVMDTGRFTDDRLRRSDDGTYVFTSWDGDTRADGHHGKWNAPDDFDSFAYTWVVPASIEIVDYSANRRGDWSHQGRNLTWRGEDVNDITFRIRYRVEAAAQTGGPPATSANASEATTESAADTAPFQPVPKRQRMAIGSHSDTRVADAAEPSPAPGRTAPQTAPTESPGAPSSDTAPIEIPNLQTAPPPRWRPRQAPIRPPTHRPAVARTSGCTVGQRRHGGVHHGCGRHRSRKRRGAGRRAADDHRTGARRARSTRPPARRR